MDYIDDFSILFWRDRLFIGERSYLLGQTTTDILNWDDKVLVELRDRCGLFVTAARSMLERCDRSAVPVVQKNLNALVDVLFTLPPYRDLSMDEDLVRNLFLRAVADGKWTETVTSGTRGNNFFRDFLQKIDALPERLYNFRWQVMQMLDQFFEDLPHRNCMAYGAAYASYLRSISTGRGFDLTNILDLEQSFPAELYFVPMQNPDQDITGDPNQELEMVVAEKTRFGELHTFLFTDFYRGMAQGHIPRRCHNCGRYFLLHSGYNTFYCSNVAPGETEKTCRKVGAHRQAEKKAKDPEHPERKEYNLATGRIRTRKSRKKVDRDEYNDLYTQAQEIKDRAERGELSDDEMRELFREI